MKKTLLSIILLSTLSFPGEIQNSFNEIDKEKNIYIKIDKKLDLILKQYIDEEKLQEARQELLDDTIKKTKTGINTAGNWIKEKTNKLLKEEVPLTNNGNTSNPK